MHYSAAKAVAESIIYIWGVKHKIRQLIISVYILIISILTVMYIQFNNQNLKVYYF